MKIIAILMLSLSLFSCAPSEANVGRQEYLGFDLNLGLQSTVVLSNYVERGDIVVYNHPNMNLDFSPKVLLVPFKISFEIDKARTLENNITRQIWQQFQAEKTFPTIEYTSYNNAPVRPELALDLARSKGADLLIGGYITQFFDGGSVGDSSVSFVYEIYDVKNNNLLWSMAHSGVMRQKKINDFFLFAVKNQMPNDPIGTVITAVSSDVAKLLAKWTNSSPNQTNNDGFFTRQAF